MRDGILVLRQAGEQAGATVKVTSRSQTLGRAADCDVVIPHVSISRRHAELLVRGTAVIVKDLNSRNGTFVDERPIDSVEVRVGQRLRFGAISFIVTRTNNNACEGSADLETASLSQAVAGARKRRDTLRLSAAEGRVFDLLLEGGSEKKIAGRLEISRHTVHNHVRKIYREAQVRSRAELLARFVSRGAGLERSSLEKNHR